MEHNMRVACVASFNFASFQALATSNMETRQQVQGQVPADKWRSVVVSLHMLLSCCLEHNNSFPHQHCNFLAGLRPYSRY